MGLGHVSVPAGDGMPASSHNSVSLPNWSLIRAFRGAMYSTPTLWGRVLVQQSEDGEKGGFRFAGGGRGGEEHVFPGTENGLAGGVLHAPQGLPAAAVDVIQDEGA